MKRRFLDLRFEILRLKISFVFVIVFILGGIFALHPSYSKNENLFLMQAPTDQASIDRGKQLYEQKCQWCHGIKGDGKGIAADKVNPKPRDFTKGTFKIRITQSGEIPTDYDIYRSITKGLSGTTMYAWEHALPDKDRWDLVSYIKTFSDRFKNEQYTKDKLLTVHAPGEKGNPYPGDPGKADAALLKEGEQIYHDPNGAKCFQCHGDHGRGNGVSADTLTDDWNNKIWPADLTKGYDYRGGDSAQDIYRDISTGLSGSPMPSYRGALDADDKKDTHKRWALAYYVKSLQTPRALGSLVKVVRVQGDLPADPKDARWDKIESVDLPLAGQVIAEPREFTPSVDNVTVKGCYNNKNVAFLVSWDDRTQDVKSGAKKYSDAAALQFPVEIPADPAQSPKPYFLSGDPDHPVDLWNWEADKTETIEQKGTGLHNVHPKEASPTVTSKPIYEDGRWMVLFTRPLSTGTKDHDIQFEIGKYIPIALSIWDGGNGEHDSQRAISAWYSALLVPPTSAKVYAAPFIAVVFGIGLQLWAARKSRDYLKS